SMSLPRNSSKNSGSGLSQYCADDGLVPKDLQ
ncbi:unnamed protein product, partial [Oikopleura dioica]